MSKQRKAMELALEALQWNWGGEPLPTLEIEAIEALKRALAEPEPALQLCKCRAALDEILAAKPRLAAGYYECGNMKDTIGNLRAELYDYRPQGVFGIGDEE